MDIKQLVNDRFSDPVNIMYGQGKAARLGRRAVADIDAKSADVHRCRGYALGHVDQIGTH